MIKTAKRRFICGGALLMFLAGVSFLGANTSFEGYWKTIDDSTEELKSIVKVWKENGELKGQIIKIFPKPGEDPDPVCDKCKGEKKDKKVIGMIFMWQFVKDEDRWVDGKILDPENGKVYHCSLELADGGKKLKVFGYIKIIFKIGRTQTWLRASEKDLS